MIASATSRAARSRLNHRDRALDALDRSNHVVDALQALHELLGISDQERVASRSALASLFFSLRTLRNDGYIGRDEAARAHSAVIELIAPASDLNDVSRGELATLVGILWQM